MLGNKRFSRKRVDVLPPIILGFVHFFLNRREICPEVQAMKSYAVRKILMIS